MISWIITVFVSLLLLGCLATHDFNSAGLFTCQYSGKVVVALRNVSYYDIWNISTIPTINEFSYNESDLPNPKALCASALMKYYSNRENGIVGARISPEKFCQYDKAVILDCVDS